MTDLTPTPDDEIVSAVLDGEATEAERARVEADPRLSARLAEFGQISDAVGAPVTGLDELSVRRLIDRAVAATGPVAPPQSQSRWSGGLAVGVGAAAAVLVALVLVPALLGSSTEQFAEVGLEIQSEGGDRGGHRGSLDQGPLIGQGGILSDDDAADAFSEEGTGGDGFDGPQPIRLGEFDTVEDFADMARVRAPTQIDPTPTTSTPPDAIERAGQSGWLADVCGAGLVNDTFGDRWIPLATYEGFVDGRTLVAVFASDDVGDIRMRVVDLNDCTVIQLP